EAFHPARPLSLKPAVVAGLNPFCGADLFVGDVPVGSAGQLDPEAARAWGLAGAVFVAELSLSALVAQPRQVHMHRSLPKFPGTRRDLAVVAERGLAAETLRSFIAKHAGGSLGEAVVEGVRLFDIYAGKPIPPTHVSLAFAIDYRSRERTLTDAEVGEAFTSVLRMLQEQFGVEVRQ
ncbi:MAG TPA: hypothetical protein VFH51_09790, partial [Myxococcota bacterium]|nr:hypothetical protein [Myxococcota bacterium]